MELEQIVERLTDLNCKDKQLMEFLQECITKKYVLSKDFMNSILSNCIVLIDTLDEERKQAYIAKDNKLEEEELMSKWDNLLDSNRADVINDIGQSKSLKEDIKELKTKYIEIAKKPKEFNEEGFKEEVNRMFSVLNTANELKQYEMTIRNIAKKNKIQMKDLKGKVDRDLVNLIKKISNQS
jgi:GTPase involved in cell partitioning and DNA repair